MAEALREVEAIAPGEAQPSPVFQLATEARRQELYQQHLGVAQQNMAHLAGQLNAEAWRTHDMRAATQQAQDKRDLAAQMQNPQQQPEAARGPLN